MKRTTSLLILIIASIGVLSCNYESAEPEIHLIPEGYMGPVLIIFDDSNADFLPYEGDARVYKIPEDGVLRTKSSQNEGTVAAEKIQFFYLSDDKSRIKLKKAFFVNMPLVGVQYIYKQQIGVAYSDIDRSERPYKTYIISTPEMIEIVHKELTELKQTVLFE